MNLKNICKKCGIKLKKLNDGLYTDGYVYVIDKTIYQTIDDYLEILKQMYELKQQGILQEKYFSIPYLNSLKQEVLKDRINDFEILENNDRYVVYISSLEYLDVNKRIDKLPHIKFD